MRREPSALMTPDHHRAIGTPAVVGSNTAAASWHQFSSVSPLITSPHPLETDCVALYWVAPLHEFAGLNQFSGGLALLHVDHRDLLQSWGCGDRCLNEKPSRSLRHRRSRERQPQGDQRDRNRWFHQPTVAAGDAAAHPPSEGFLTMG